MVETKKEIFEMLRRLAIFKGEVVTEERLQLYVEYLSGKYNIGQIAMAVEVALKTNPRFPDISFLIKEIEQEPSEREVAANKAGIILEAANRFGELDAASAKKEIGDDLWQVVEKFGGWSTITRLTYDELGTARAQLRDLCGAINKINTHKEYMIENTKKGLIAEKSYS